MNAAPMIDTAQPTSQGYNAAAAQTYPRTRADYAIRGTAGNTAMNVVRGVRQNQEMRELQRQYEELLARGERAADEVVSSAVQKYGSGVTGYLPPKDLFRDPQSGQFMTQKYTEAVYVGVKKFQEESDREQSRERATAAQGAIFGGEQIPADRAQAAAMIGPGTTREEMESAGIGYLPAAQLPGPVDPLDLRIKQARAEGAELDAAGKRRDLSAPPKQERVDPAVEFAKKDYNDANNRITPIEARFHSYNTLYNQVTKNLADQSSFTGIIEKNVQDPEEQASLAGLASSTDPKKFQAWLLTKATQLGDEVKAAKDVAKEKRRVYDDMRIDSAKRGDKFSKVSIDSEQKAQVEKAKSEIIQMWPSPQQAFAGAPDRAEDLMVNSLVTKGYTEDIARQAVREARGGGSYGGSAMGGGIDETRRMAEESLRDAGLDESNPQWGSLLEEILSKVGR